LLELPQELNLTLPSEDAPHDTTLPVMADGECIEVQRVRVILLVGMFGAGDKHLIGRDAFNASAVIGWPFPTYYMVLAPYLQLLPMVSQYAKDLAEQYPNDPDKWQDTTTVPCHRHCLRNDVNRSSFHTYRKFSISLRFVRGFFLGRVLLTSEFLSRPELPDFKNHIPESEAARLTYFALMLPERRRELRERMYSNVSSLVRILQELQEDYARPNLAYGFYRNPRAAADRDFKAELAMLLGEWMMVGGVELLRLLASHGGGEFLRMVGGDPFA